MIKLNRMTAIEAKLDALMTKMGNHERRMHSANEVGTVDENEKSNNAKEGLADSCHSRVIRNQQYLYPKFPPTVVVKLLQYSGYRVEHRNGFSSYR